MQGTSAHIHQIHAANLLRSGHQLRDPNATLVEIGNRLILVKFSLTRASPRRLAGKVKPMSGLGATTRLWAAPGPSPSISENSELVRRVRLLPMVLSAGKIRSYAGEDKLQCNQTAILVGTCLFLLLGTFRTWPDVRLESVERSKADITIEGRQVRF